MRLPHAFRSLAHRDLRLFFGGQCISLVGTWMQSVALGWLVYRLTHSSQMLGLVGFLSQVPVAFLGIWAGSLADRLPRRRVVLATQLNSTLQAAILATITLTGVVRPWHLLFLATMLGLSYAFEIPARQALLGDIAGEDLPNAIAINSSVVNSARVAGPAFAGFLVALIGEGWCFALNAASFAGTIYALMVMTVPRQPPLRQLGQRDHLLEGLAYAWRTPHVRWLLWLLAASSFFALPYVTLLPIFAGDIFHGTARLFGAFQASAGIGALMGAIGLLFHKGLRGLGRRVAIGATLLGGGLAAFSLSRSPMISCAALMVAGLGFSTQMASTMTLLQGSAPPEMRGRVMGLYSTLFVGTTPFGTLVAGSVAEQIGAPPTLLAGGLIVVAASVVFHFALPKLRRMDAKQRPFDFPAAVPPVVGK